VALTAGQQRQQQRSKGVRNRARTETEWACTCYPMSGKHRHSAVLLLVLSAVCGVTQSCYQNYVFCGQASICSWIVLLLWFSHVTYDDGIKHGDATCWAAGYLPCVQRHPAACSPNNTL
jgi:hypothetical protein